MRTILEMRRMPSGRRLGALMACVVCMWTGLAGVAAAAEPPNHNAPGERVVHCPADRPLGRLQVRDWDASEGDWQNLGEAKGDVHVPAQKALRLEVSKEGAANLSGLAECGPGTLQEIDLHELRVESEQLKHIGRLRGLRQLKLSKLRTSGDGLAVLRGLRDLEALTLTKCDLSDRDLKAIGSIRSLKRLDLSRTSITDDGLAFLKGLKHLESLDLSHTRIGDAGLRRLTALKALKDLDLSDSKVEGPGLKELAKLTALQSLDLPACVPPESMEALKALPVYGKLAARRVFRLSVVDTKTGKGIAGADVTFDVADNKTKTTTNAEGRVTCYLPKGKESYFRVEISKEGYVPMHAVWQANESEAIPEEFTLETEPGTAIGGVIVNEDNKPVQGATVKLLVPSDNKNGSSGFTVLVS